MMKLLNVSGCQSPGAGGNEFRLTKLVEVQGMGLRTRVRLPSSPLCHEEGLTRSVGGVLMTYADAHPDEVRILMALLQSKPLGNQYVLRWFLFYLG